MNITCENCNEVLKEYLYDIPSEWRDQMVKAICSALSSCGTISCSDVKSCETVTTLSAFTVEEGQVCITYKDEDGQEWERCFSFDDVMNSTLDGVDPKCITDAETWAAMTYAERIQAIVDYACTCEEVTTTTTTTSTTTSSTTTTTTTP